MRVLGIETTTKIGTLAIIEDEKLLGEEVISVEMEHAGNFENALGKLMQNLRLGLDALDGFAVSIGPGSFTGIRVGISIAKGLNFSLGKAVVGVPSLDVLAYDAPCKNTKLCPVIAGESGEIYGALYEKIGEELYEVLPEFSVKVQNLRETIQCDAFIFGPAIAQYEDILKESIGEEYMCMYPKASKVAQLGRMMLRKGIYQCEPKYIKPLKVLQFLKEI